MTIKQTFAPVTRKINSLMRTFDEEYSASLATDFAACSEKSFITYAIAVSELQQSAFSRNFVRRFPACADFNPWTLALMHEIGHLEMAWDDIDDRAARQRLQALYDTNPAQANSRYFRLHNERNATDWAGEYLTAHHDEMRVWEIKIMKTLKKVLDKIIDE